VRRTLANRVAKARGLVVSTTPLADVTRARAVSSKTTRRQRQRSPSPRHPTTVVNVAGKLAKAKAKARGNRVHVNRSLRTIFAAYAFELEAVLSRIESTPT
jgi:hypothetical protein